MKKNASNNFNGAISCDFSKGVHDYLTHYIDVADTKAGVIIGLASALVTFSVNRVGSNCYPILWLATFLEIIAIGLSIYVVFPRLYTGKKGYIFWDDILTFNSPDSYALEIGELSEMVIERDYSKQNFYLSRILNKKYTGIRLSMIVFLAGAGLVGLSILF